MNPTSTPTLPLADRHGRTLDYLRLAVTDRCNLRCTYCMPAEGLQWVRRESLLSFEEMRRLVGVLHAAGLRRVRLTGGEPFLRKDLPVLLRALAAFDGLQIAITTNGTRALPHLPLLKALGIRDINLSLDTLRPKRFAAIARRDNFEQVHACLAELLEPGWNLKINAVALPDADPEEWIELTELARTHAVAVRFLEQMPFNGGQSHPPKYLAKDILQHVQKAYPQLQSIGPSSSGTAERYSTPDMVGSVGIIPAFSRSFCGSCNRLRITPEGALRTCLYAKNELSVRDALRSGCTDAELLDLITRAIRGKAIDGFAAEAAASSRESMATIGG